jgi:hypothetical protein
LWMEGQQRRKAEKRLGFVGELTGDVVEESLAQFMGTHGDDQSVKSESAASARPRQPLVPRKWDYMAAVSELTSTVAEPCSA